MTTKGRDLSRAGLARLHNAEAALYLYTQRSNIAVAEVKAGPQGMIIDLIATLLLIAERAGTPAPRELALEGIEVYNEQRAGGP